MLGCHGANTLAEAEHVIHIRGRRQRRLHIVSVGVGLGLASRAAPQIGVGLGCSCNLHERGTTHPPIGLAPRFPVSLPAAYASV